MIQADVGGLDENMGSQWAGMDTVERDVPHTYLSDDADLKVEKTPQIFTWHL